MRTREQKNGVVKEAIVLQRAVRIASCDFEHGKKRWAGALLSEKCSDQLKYSPPIAKKSGSGHGSHVAASAMDGRGHGGHVTLSVACAQIWR